MATVLVKLYNYHDDDLLQLKLNGLDLGFIFSRALAACFRREKIRFVFPKKLVLDKTRRKSCRVRITLNDKTQNDICTWLEGFEPFYRNQAIKNIARMYLGGGGINCFNAFYQSGKWESQEWEEAEEIMVPLLHKKKKEEDPEKWLDQIGKGKIKRGMTGKAKQKAIQEMKNTPLQALMESPSKKTKETIIPTYQEETEITPDEHSVNQTPEPILEEKAEHILPEYGIMQEEQKLQKPELTQSVTVQEELHAAHTQPTYVESTPVSTPATPEPQHTFLPPDEEPSEELVNEEPETHDLDDYDDEDDDYDVRQIFDQMTHG